MTSKSTVHGEHKDVFRFHEAEHSVEDRDSLFRVRVAAFSLLGEDFPNDRDGDFVDDHSDGENIDMALTILPVATIHGENPTAFGPRDFV